MGIVIQAFRFELFWLYNLKIMILKFEETSVIEILSEISKH